MLGWRSGLQTVHPLSLNLIHNIFKRMKTVEGRQNQMTGKLIPNLICQIVCGIVLFAGAVPAVQAQSINDEIARYLTLVEHATHEALEASKKAEKSSSVAAVKAQTDRVFEAMWGVPSGIAEAGASGAVATHGWKTRWQSDTTDFKLETPEKFGTEPAQITDPSKLGIIGSGRRARKLIWADSMNANPHYNHVVASLSNIVGWMRMDYAPARGGMPRVDLTYQWDAPSAFWQSTADTGWIFEVYVQAMNILKTNYGNDLASARKHAADLTVLLEKVMLGEDADGNGAVEPKAMEGGLNTAMQHARLAGFNLL